MYSQSINMPFRCLQSYDYGLQACDPEWVNTDFPNLIVVHCYLYDYYDRSKICIDYEKRGGKHLYIKILTLN